MANESKNSPQQGQSGTKSQGAQTPSKDSGTDFGTRGKAATTVSDTQKMGGAGGQGQAGRDAGRGQQSAQDKGGQGKGAQGKGAHGMDAENQGQTKDKAQRPGAEDINRDEGSEEMDGRNKEGRSSNASNEQRDQGKSCGT